LYNPRAFRELTVPHRKDIMTLIRRTLAAALFLSPLTTSAYAQRTASVPDSSANSAPAAQADAPEALKALLGEILIAVKSNDTAKYSAYFSSLAFPDDGAWLTKEFGPTEGPRLKSQYMQLASQEPQDLKKLFAYALQDSRTDVTVKIFARGTEPKLGVLRAAIAAMKEPSQIYTAEGSKPGNAYAVALGNFVYVDGAFRFLSGQVLQALSTAPPVRIRIGGNVLLAKLRHKVDPVYPPEAQAAHIKGTVQLRVILGVDGTPISVEVENGDPALARAAVEAVRQWRYEPTKLNGAPVEVDSSIDVVFK
jgi:TonB family protein